MKSKQKEWLTLEEIARRNYRNFRLLLSLGIFFLGPLFGLLASFPLLFPDLPHYLMIFFWVYWVVYVIQLVSYAALFRFGLSQWWVVFISSLMAGMGISGVSGFFAFSPVHISHFIFLVLLSWLLIFPLVWWWGARVYCSKGEIKEAVLRSKRIDLEKGTYSPYHYPADLFQASWARSAVALSSVVGGLAIGLAAYLSHLTNAHFADGNSLTGAVSGYLLAILSVAVISAVYHEWLWIHRWEKKTGRKIYVKEIIEYKHLQERKQAERAKLNASKNCAETGRRPAGKGKE